MSINIKILASVVVAQFNSSTQEAETADLCEDSQGYTKRSLVLKKTSLNNIICILLKPLGSLFSPHSSMLQTTLPLKNRC